MEQGPRVPGPATAALPPRAMRPSRLGVAPAILAAAILAGVAACAPAAPTLTPLPYDTPVPSGSGVAQSSAAAPSATVPLSPPQASPGAAASVTPGGPLASKGSIVVLGNDGSLSLVDTTRRSILLSPGDDASAAFPVWSPDGSRIAAIRARPSGSDIRVFDAGRAATGGPIDGVEIFNNSSISPFYLSWTPDGREVSFLASDSADLALRLAPADGSAPLDGSGPGAVVSRGSPFYFDWIEPDRLLAHVGVGTDALLGEIRLDGTPAAPAVHSPGVFNAPVMSADRNYIGYVRALAADGADNASDFAAQVVLASRDGSSEHTMPEFGVAAVAFDPSGDRIASIGATDEASSRLAIPFGPLRVMDAQSGTERTLLDGSVFAFWWSPDGRTIAALRVQTALDAPSKSPLPSPTSDTREIRLLFVDVASGSITSEAPVDLGPLFINQLLMYFDQYTLSHHLWAPDSSSILVPVVDAGGATRVAVMFRNGDPPAMIDGAIGFWSP